VGLVEDDSSAVAGYKPIANVAAFQDRLTDVLGHYCQPNVGVTFRPVPIEEGHALVIDVAESLAPVMRLGGKENCYYHRVDRKSRPMNEREVRERYERVFVRHEVVERLIEQARPQSGWTMQSEAVAWLTILCVPSFGHLDMFNPATGFQLKDHLRHVPQLRSERLKMPVGWPTYFGLETRWGDQKEPRMLLRLHRSGVIEYHHAVYADGVPDWLVIGPHAGPVVRLKIVGLDEARAALDFLELAEGLYREAGYASDVHIRGHYTDLVGRWMFAAAGGGHEILHDPQAHSMDTSVARLRDDRREFVQGLLDRVWQAGGWIGCPLEQLDECP
jgi:hypothetical protein